MALDRFVRWKKPADRPTDQQVTDLLKSYVGPDITIEHGRQGNPADPWLFVKLPGKPSDPAPRPLRDERWFEVALVHSDSIDVITRQADSFTNDLAVGFAKLAARYFKGEFEEEK